MTTPDPVDANMALWAYYFEHEWPAFPDPLVRRFVARGAGTAVAVWLTLMQGPEVARLFDENAGEVSAFAAQVAWQAPDEVPEEFRRSEPAARTERLPPERVAFVAPWREAVATA
jgi:hypothetical protein